MILAKPQKGFSLIELMVTVAIVAILAAVGMPMYQDYVKKAHRSAAAQWVSDIASRQGQFILDNRTYGTLAQIGMTSPPSTVSDYYDISLTIVTGVAPFRFTASANPKSGGMHDGEASVTINHLNQKAGPEGAWGD